MIGRNLLALALAVPMLAAPAAASLPDRKEAKSVRKSQDHDLARQAVLRREVLPLPRILTLAGGYQAGEVIEIELKSRRGMLQYDVHVLTAAGVVRELLIDARTGKLLVNQIKAD